ncbi:hypothetical protein B566_EDAN011441, partial [Ephemera danica]
MAESNTTYERRVGVDASHGIDFEWQTTNLAYLRCEKLHRQWVQDNTLGVKSYFVANNVDGIGAFDDVVIRVEYTQQNCKPQDCEFILYSNMILDAGLENTQTQQDNDISMKILNTAQSNYYEKLTKQNATTNDTVEMKNVISRIIKTMEEETELMAIPLQITMLAEIYFEKFSDMTTEEKMSFSIKMDICSLYNAFIEKLVVRFLVEKKKLDLLNMQDKHRTMEIENTMRDAEELACKLICPDINQTPLAKYDDAVLKMCNQVGLITNIDPPVFLHRTYASKYLLSLNCSVNMEDINGMTPLHLASMRGYVEIIKRLLQRDGTLLNQQDKRGRTPLHCVFEIIENDIYGTTSHEECKVNTQDKNGDTPFHLISFNQERIDDDERIMNTIINLIKHDSSILNIKNHNGQTPLHIAVKYNRFKVADLLVRLGADVNIKDNDNRTPLELALRSTRELHRDEGAEPGLVWRRVGAGVAGSMRGEEFPEFGGV